MGSGDGSETGSVVNEKENQTRGPLSMSAVRHTEGEPNSRTVVDVSRQTHRRRTNVAKVQRRILLLLGDWAMTPI